MKKLLFFLLVLWSSFASMQAQCRQEDWAHSSGKLLFNDDCTRPTGPITSVIKWLGEGPAPELSNVSYKLVGTTATGESKTYTTSLVSPTYGSTPNEMRAQY